MDREAFFASLRETESGCMEWARGRNSKGYGYLRFNGRDLRAHRLAYEFAYGAITPGMLVLHKCDNPACCNPEHLFSGTPADNQRDKVEKGRHATQVGKSNNYARLDEDQVRNIRALRQAGEPVATIAIRFGVHQTTVSKITTRATWRHI